MVEKLELLAQLKKEKNAVILAHYYTNDDIQKAADYVGDSYFLSEKAREVKEDIIVMCGVSFMGESVKLLNPDKIVLVPAFGTKFASESFIPYLCTLQT